MTTETDRMRELRAKYQRQMDQLVLEEQIFESLDEAHMERPRLAVHQSYGNELWLCYGDKHRSLGYNQSERELRDLALQAAVSFGAADLYHHVGQYHGVYSEWGAASYAEECVKRDIEIRIHEAVCPYYVTIDGFGNCLSFYSVIDDQRVRFLFESGTPLHFGNVRLTGRVHRWGAGGPISRIENRDVEFAGRGMNDKGYRSILHSGGSADSWGHATIYHRDSTLGLAEFLAGLHFGEQA